MIDGCIEVLNCSFVRGWVAREDFQGPPLSVIVRLKGSIFAETIADIFRSDLENGALKHGMYGFALNINITEEDVKFIKVFTVINGREIEIKTADGVAYLSIPFISSDSSHYPVFILGAARSGTSAMFTAISSSSIFNDAYPEGHVFDLMYILVDRVFQHYNLSAEVIRGRTMLSSVPQGVLLAGLGELFIKIARARHSTPYWVDKTPTVNMIRAAPLLKATWPNAKFVFMKRHGVENLSSRLRRFPDQKFDVHCLDWADAMYQWSIVRDQLRGEFIEIEQNFMWSEPGRVAHEIADFLGLDESESELINCGLRNQAVEKTAESVTERKYLSDLWTQDMKSTFWKICGKMMSIYGYS